MSAAADALRRTLADIAARDGALKSFVAVHLYLAPRPDSLPGYAVL